MRTPPYDIHQRRPATAVRACHSLSFSFSLSPLPFADVNRAVIRCHFGYCPRRRLALRAPVRLLSYFAYSGCRPDHRETQEYTSSRRGCNVFRSCPLRSLFESTPMESVFSIFGSLRQAGYFYRASFFSFPSSPRELYRFLIGDWSTPCLR